MVKREESEAGFKKCSSCSLCLPPTCEMVVVAMTIEMAMIPAKATKMAMKWKYVRFVVYAVTEAVTKYTMKNSILG